MACLFGSLSLAGRGRSVAFKNRFQPISYSQNSLDEKEEGRKQNGTDILSAKACRVLLLENLSPRFGSLYFLSNIASSRSSCESDVALKPQNP